jgi:glycerol uptake facilitator protein
VVAQVVAGGALTDPPGGLGNHDSIAWAWGIGVTLGIYVAARLSGAHLNPAVTLAPAAFKGFPWSKVAPYALVYFWVPIIGPLAGGLVGAFLYKFFVGRFLPTAGPEPPGRVPTPEA